MGDLIKTNKLDQETQELVSQAINETDPKKVKDLTDLFNAAIQKKSMVRITKLNDLLDRTTDQAIERFEKQPDQFSNKELLDYMNTVSTISDRAVANLKEANAAPPIQLNQQNNSVNINMGTDAVAELNRESRRKILDAVNSILKQSGEEIIDSEPAIKSEDRSTDTSV